MASRDLVAERARRVIAGLVDDEVPSPCISVCRMEADTELCEGCYRTLDEIAAWGRMSPEEKKQVWWLIAHRIAQDDREIS